MPSRLRESLESTLVLATWWQRSSRGEPAFSLTSRSQSNRGPLAIGLGSPVSSTMRYSRRSGQPSYTTPPIGLAAGCVPESGARTGRRWRGGACLITRPSSAAGSVAPVKFSFQEVDSRRRHRCTGCQSRRRHPPDWRVAGGGHPPAGWMRPCLNGIVGITISTLTRSNPRQRRHRHVWRVARTDHAAQAGVFHPHTHCLFTRWYTTHHPIGDVADRAGRPHYGSRCSGSAACVPSTSPACRTCATRAAQIWRSSAAVAVTKYVAV